MVAHKYKKRVFEISGFDDVSFNSMFAKMKFTVIYGRLVRSRHRSAPCGHRSLGALTDLPFAVTDHSVRSPTCSVR